MNYTFDNLPNSAVLRADSHSQKTTINTPSGLESDLISEEQFWGSSEKLGLYYSYQSPQNSGFTKAHEGWDYFCVSDACTMNAEKTTEWIKNNVLVPKTKNLCIFQGYAGCGKTTLVHDILRQAIELGSYSDYHDLYIGYNKNDDENLYIVSSIQNSIVNKIISTLREDDGIFIYTKFCELFSDDLSKLNPSLSTDFSALFNSKTDVSLFDYAKKIYESRNSVSDIFEKKYRVQFNTAFETKVAKLRYWEKKQNLFLSDYYLNILIYFDLLWHSAVSLTKKSTNGTNHLIIYDNLDIIDNHEIVAKFICTLATALSNYNDFKKNYESSSEEYKNYLPSFKAILTVRKITYSEVSKFIEVGYNEKKIEPPDIDFLDVSCLYPPSSVLKYKSKVLLDNFDSFIPKSAKSYSRIKNYLSEVNEMSEDLFSEIKIADLFNQNIRACANIVDQVISSDLYSKHLKSSKNLSVPTKSAIWIHIICKILRDHKVWDNLGYNNNLSSDVTHPTTLSRMILTLLSNYKQGYYKKIGDYESCDISFKDIVEIFESFPFCNSNNITKWDKTTEKILLSKWNTTDTQNRIVDSIAKMLQRNKSADKNAISVEDMELWRRPIFYTKNSFSIRDINETKNYLHEQIRNFNTPNYPITSFCITDEGSTFVEKIATHFEFASIRFNDNNAIPLCCINDETIMDDLISTVFNEISNCVEKQIWLINYFENSMNINKNDYLIKKFHPRTESNRPQLHIVRMIYDHIKYLNSCREFLNCENTKAPLLDHCLLKWIGKYLQLYKLKLYPILNETIGKYNNDVWLDLKYLYWLIFDKKIDENKFVSINRYNNKLNRSSNKDHAISDEELMNKPMLID